MVDYSNATLITLGGLIAQKIDPHDVAHSEWPHIITLAATQRLGPLLYWIVSRGAPEQTGASMWNPLKGAARQNALWYTTATQHQQCINTHFAAQDIPCLWLKGMALAPSVYPQPVLRTMSDLDVLVPLEHRLTALEALLASGYQMQPGKSKFVADDKHLITTMGHAFNLMSASEPRIFIDLHYRLPGKLLRIADLPWFWEQTMQVAPDNACTILKPEAQLLHLAAHIALQHGADHPSIRLRSYADVHLLVMHYALDWQLVIDQAEAFNWIMAVEHVLTIITRVFRTDIPADVLEQLRAKQKDQPVDFVHQLPGEEKLFFSIIRQMKHLSFREKLHYVLRTLFPPPDMIRARYQLPSSTRVWSYYPRRWLYFSWLACRSVWSWARHRYSNTP